MTESGNSKKMENTTYARAQKLREELVCWRRQLHQNPELCEKMSSNAVRLYTEKYAKDIGLNKYAALFKNVLRTAN